MAIKIPDFKIRENLVVKGTATLQQTLATSGDSTLGGDVTINSNLHTLGNATIDGSLTVNGEMTFVESSSIRLEDPLITLGHGNSAADVNDIGFFSTYYDTSLSGIRYTGLFRDATDGIYKLFNGLATDPAAGGIDTTDSGFSIASLSANVDGDNISDNSIANSKLVNNGLTVNNRSVALGGNIDVPVHEHRDSCSIDISVNQEMISSAMTDVLSANVRYSDSTIDCLPDGIRVVPGQLTSTHLSAGSINNDRLANSSLYVNNRVVSLGGTIDVPVHEHRDSCTVDITVNQEMISGAMTDVLSANVKIADSTIECLTAEHDCDSGIRVAEGQLTNAHLSGGTFSINSIAANIGGNVSLSLQGAASATDTISLSVTDDVLYGDVVDGSITNAHIANPTFSVNGVETQLGGNVSISLQGVTSATDSINMFVQDDVLFGDVRLSDNTLTIDTDAGLRLTTKSLSVNGYGGDLGENIQIPLIAGHCNTASIIHYNHPSYDNPGEEHLCADIRLSDTSLQVLSTGLSGLSISPGGVSAIHISNNTVQTDHISAGVITNAKLATPTFSVNGQAQSLGGNISISLHGTASATDTLSLSVIDDVLVGDVVDESITTAKLGPDAVTSDKIIDDAVGTEHIQDSAVTTDTLNANSVTTAKLGLDAVTSATVADDAIGNEHIQDNAVGTDTLSAGVVTNAKLATPTFSINEVVTQLGDNLSLSLQGTVSSTDTISLDVDDDVLRGNVVDGSITNTHIATPTFSVNGIETTLGNNVQVSTQNDPMYLNHSIMNSLSAAIGMTDTTFDTIPLTTCETFTYNIQIKHPDHSLHHRQLSTLLVLYDGTDVLMTETGVCSLASDIANFTAVISGGDILVQASHTLSAGEAVLKAVRTCFQ